MGGTVIITIKKSITLDFSVQPLWVWQTLPGSAENHSAPISVSRLSDFCDLFTDPVPLNSDSTSDMKSGNMRSVLFERMRFYVIRMVRAQVFQCLVVSSSLSLHAHTRRHVRTRRWIRTQLFHFGEMNVEWPASLQWLPQTVPFHLKVAWKGFSSQ